MRRVVITGMGIVSSIGNSLSGVSEALREGRSGIIREPRFGELGFRGQLCGTVEDPDLAARLGSRKKQRYMCRHAGWAVMAAMDAITDAGLSLEQIREQRCAVVTGSGHGSSLPIRDAAEILAAGKPPKRIGPFSIPKIMASAAPANISVTLQTRGRSYAVSSACASGSHAIGLAADLIRWGREELVLTGGSDEYDEILGGCFDAMRAFSEGFNEKADGSRPYDARRDGFVPSGGAGLLVVESLQSARERGARIYCEVLGHAANSDGSDMFAPNREVAAACMRDALKDAAICPADIDYVNTHGTSTVKGDAAEVAALRDVFAGDCPPFSSSKSMTGHAFGAAGAIEAIFCALMLQQGFAAPSINIETVDPEFAQMPIVQTARELPLRRVMSNSLGFGGTNGVLILARLD